MTDLLHFHVDTIKNQTDEMKRPVSTNSIAILITFKVLISVSDNR